MSTDELEKALEERGIRVNIAGCGCCNSPWVKIEIDGEVVFDEDDADIKMIEEDS